MDGEDDAEGDFSEEDHERNTGWVFGDDEDDDDDDDSDDDSDGDGGANMDIDEVLPGGSFRHFHVHVWNEPAVRSWSIVDPVRGDDVLRRLRAGFFNGQGGDDYVNNIEKERARVRQREAGGSERIAVRSLVGLSRYTKDRRRLWTRLAKPPFYSFMHFSFLPCVGSTTTDRMNYTLRHFFFWIFLKKSSTRGRMRVKVTKRDPAHGDVREVLRRCRKESNAAYTPAEVDQMASDLEDGGRTLNLPFCFTPGARELKRSLMLKAYNARAPRHAVRDGDDDHDNDFKLCHVNDVEVGVYFSSAGGGVEAGWHYDNNHNVPIQLYRSKDWHTTGAGLNRNASSSRGEADCPSPHTTFTLPCFIQAP